MNYQWYPGHMTKAIRSMQEDIKLIDLVIEIVDARIPVSSRNPDIDKLAQGKGRLILLNKSDLADNKANKEWLEYYKSQNIQALLIDSRKSTGLKDIQKAVNEACSAKIERDRKRGIKNRPLRAMVCGIPNVGKSTFINAISKKAATKTGNKPGVTKGKQWIRLNQTLELLDTPGILWPKFEDNTVGMHIAMIGSINDEILHVDELAADIIDFMKNNYGGRLAERYGVEEVSDNFAILEAIGKARGCLIKGGEIDYIKASNIVIDEFRSGKLGNITIETVNK
jgi:ribosome biogenesis GTPase A